ncbi:MAG: hypothetical protein ACJ75H_01860 [Thermoanaerobaculia bacterium]
MPPTGVVDPNGFQTASTGAALAGMLAAGLGEGTSDTFASLLGIAAHPTQVMTAGFSMISLGRMSLFVVGMVLIGLSIVLNIASLSIRWQRSYAERRYFESYQLKIQELKRRYADAGTGSKVQSLGSIPPVGRVDPNG